MPTALITGITGQDGSYLAEYLLSLGYEVHGIVRRTSLSNLERLRSIVDRLVLHEGDLSDQSSLNRVIYQIKPDEIYNLAAQSHVHTSWSEPVLTGDVTGLGAVRVYEAARSLQQEYGESPRIYQASTSELFGDSTDCPQSEETPFQPHSPYGCAKLYAHTAAKVYVESFDLYISCGILFNHESPRRGPQFVTRKITSSVARIVLGIQSRIKLGNLDARRDWGYAPDFVRVMHRMLQQPEPDDFVIGTGTSHSVAEFVQAAFASQGVTDWERHVEIDPKFVRPKDIQELRANPEKAKRILGWEPETAFEDWVAEMVQADKASLSGAIKQHTQ